MQNKLTFNKFATALAALGATALSPSSVLASPVHLAEVDVVSGAEGQVAELGETGETDDDKKKKDDGGDKKKDDSGEKKKKKHGGDEGGCGAGTCG